MGGQSVSVHHLHTGSSSPTDYLPDLAVSRSGARERPLAHRQGQGSHPQWGIAGVGDGSPLNGTTKSIGSVRPGIILNIALIGLPLPFLWKRIFRVSGVTCRVCTVEKCGTRASHAACLDPDCQLAGVAVDPVNTLRL
ncbi:hypothetical protein LIA77_03480 [Sarocladium implicatum]|nr:hypothetical protein LIA77_03480 [Sarocladium implicatum]